MPEPVYAVCEKCEFLRAFAASAHPAASRLPQRCPACGREISFHARGERFPSTYVGRVSRALHASPPLRV